MHTENQLPRLPGSALKVPVVVVVVVVGSYPLLSQAPTHVEVELGCDNSDARVSYHKDKTYKCLNDLFKDMIYFRHDSKYLRSAFLFLVMYEPGKEVSEFLRSYQYSRC